MIKNYEEQLYILMQLALREYIGAYTLDDKLQRKESISTQVVSAIKDKASEMGLELFSAGVKDIILPGDVKDIINQVLIAEKKAQANVIMRREETASTRSLLNTAKIMDENKTLYRLKELEYIERISEKISSITLSSTGQSSNSCVRPFRRRRRNKERRNRQARSCIYPIRPEKIRISDGLSRSAILSGGPRGEW